MDRFAVRLDWFTFRHFVIDPFPFALDLDATFAASGGQNENSLPWQWALTHLVQHDHSHGSLLVSRRVGHGVGVAAGQQIYRTFGRIHRHVELLSGHPLCDQRPNANLAVARDELHPGSALDTALLREFAATFRRKVSGTFSRIPWLR